jgi:hypothetical protein
MKSGERWRWSEKMKRWKIILYAGLVTIILCACAEESDDPAETVERYLRAKVAGDTSTVQTLLCAEMESALMREASAFSSVSAQIEGLACQPGDDVDKVVCAGQIVASYGAENTTFPLGTYRVVHEDEGWKWCGEAR